MEKTAKLYIMIYLNFFGREWYLCMSYTTLDFGTLTKEFHDFIMKGVLNVKQINVLCSKHSLSINKNSISEYTTALMRDNPLKQLFPEVLITLLRNSYGEITIHSFSICDYEVP